MAIPSRFPKKYEVFLCSSGVDDQDKFAARLLDALHRENITTSNAYHDIREEKYFHVCPISKAIEESAISVIIFSENSARTVQCLNDLTHMLKCEQNGQAFIPVFYNVDPSDVQNQQGSYATAFSMLETHFQREMVQQWREALSYAASTGRSSWCIEPLIRPESKSVQAIIRYVRRILHSTLARINLESQVGIERRIVEIEELMCTSSCDTRVVVIWGTGGVGKTTLAEAVYSRLSSQFECHYFLANVREESMKSGLPSLQKKLLPKLFKELDGSVGFAEEMDLHGKVLLVLDDLDDPCQFELLAKKQYNWFSAGSKIIVTTQDEHLLSKIAADGVYKVKELNYDNSLKLFCLNTFRNNSPVEDYLELSKRIVKHNKGNPLVIQILGSCLRGKCTDKWRSVTDDLEKNPNASSTELFRMCYDSLNRREKNVFLDIACFFKGMDREFVETVLDDPHKNVHAKEIIDSLITKSLVTIKNRRQLWMHDSIQEMGWKIVGNQSSGEPGRRSRLWDSQDVYHVLQDNTGTAAIRGISLDKSKNDREIELSPTTFEKMHNLRLLIISSADDITKKWNVHLPEGLHSFPSSLSYLHWHEYPSESLPSNFKPENLVKLVLTNSHIVQLWDEGQHLRRLESIDLSYSKKFANLPDFNNCEAPNLKVINLQCCTSLAEVHSSIEVLDKLRILNLSGCSSIQKLPSMLPKNLTSLDLSCTSIREVPSSIDEHLRNLETLDLENCKSLEKLSISVHKLKYLKRINLSGCSKLKEFPIIKERVTSLKDLTLDGTAIVVLPWWVENLIGIERLSLKMCENLGKVSEKISQLNSLNELNICCCPKLTYLPSLPVYLENLSAESCTSLAILENKSRTQGWDDSFPYPGGRFNFMNCLKLNDIALTHIMDEAQFRISVVETSSSKVKEGGISETWCPGNDIPKWFSSQSSGSSIQIGLPSNWRSTNFLGFALAVVVDFKKCRVDNNFAFYVQFGLAVDSQPVEVVDDILIFNWDNDSKGSDHNITVDSPHVVLFNYCNKNSFTAKYDKNVTGASFIFYSKSSRCKVKRCGIRLLYAKSEKMTLGPHSYSTPDVGKLSETIDGLTDTTEDVEILSSSSIEEEDEEDDEAPCHWPDSSGTLDVKNADIEKEENMKTILRDSTHNVGKSSSSSSLISEEKEDGTRGDKLEISGSLDGPGVDTKKEEDMENRSQITRDVGSCCLTFLSPVVDIFSHVCGRIFGSGKVLRIMRDLREHNNRISQYLQTANTPTVTPSQPTVEEKKLDETPQELIDSLCNQIIDVQDQNNKILAKMRTPIPTTPKLTSSPSASSVHDPLKDGIEDEEQVDVPEEIIHSLRSHLMELRSHNQQFLELLDMDMPNSNSPTTLASR